MLETEANLTITKPADHHKSANLSFQQIVSRQLGELHAYHRSVLENGGIEAIHKMRVTTRRLQASLDLLVTPDDEINIRQLKRTLRKWRRKLSLVRNYDVFLEMVGKEAASRKRSGGRHFDFLKGVLQARRDELAHKVNKYLEQVDIDLISARLGLPPVTAPSLLAEGGLSLEERTELIEEGASTEVRPHEVLTDEKAVVLRAAGRIEQRLAELHALAARSHRSTDPAELHELRIAAKRLRYLLEIVSETGYGDASRALTALRKIQDQIGDWHDLEGIEHEVVDIVCRPKQVRNYLAEGGGSLLTLAHLQKKKKALVKRIFPVAVPKSITSTSTRMVKTLRRRAAQLS